jgi:alkaline phosphatase
MIVELLKLLTLPVAVAGVAMGADVSALADTYGTRFEQVGQHGVGKDSAAEIVATDGADLLVYTNSEKGSVDFVNIADPSAPVAAGSIDVGGEPTSVAVAKGMAFVAVNTSKSYTEPSGKLLIIDIYTRDVLQETALAGQPDSIAVDVNNKFIAIAIENERNEDINGALIPQYPAGNLAIVDTLGNVKYVDLRGLASIAPSDPEPEFVDINGLGEIVVTLQENNHIVIVDRNGNIVNHFSAGLVDLNNIDTVKDGVYNPVNSLKNVRREPDAVKWIDDTHFATANEGDYKVKIKGQAKRGGSRGWTIWNKDGTVVYESAESFETALAEAGYWPDKRAGKKGVEPESIEVTTIDGHRVVFVGAERANAVGVYDVSNLSAPKLLQILPTGKAPEGLVAIPERRLFVTSNEKDAKNSLSIFKF